MMAANYRHIGGQENRLGRHYSRFPPFSPAVPLARQLLAAQKFRSGGSNRRSQASAAGRDHASVADVLLRERRQDRNEGHRPCPLHDLPDDRSGGAAADVPSES